MHGCKANVFLRVTFGLCNVTFVCLRKSCVPFPLAATLTLAEFVRSREQMLLGALTECASHCKMNANK